MRSQQREALGKIKQGKYFPKHNGEGKTLKFGSQILI